jgi:hypothetical protein
MLYNIWERKSLIAEKFYNLLIYRFKLIFFPFINLP